MLNPIGVIKHARPLAIALLVVFTLAGAVVGLAMANEGGPALPDGMPFDLTHLAADVSACAGCHAAVVGEWTDGPHALAFSNQTFQSAWQEARQDGTCLDCHTTNYTPATGTYTEEGVTCAACHGEVPSGHPDEPVDLNAANTACANCHTVTHAEFRASPHALIEEITCTTCHYAHSNGLRLESETAQCLRCHGGQLGDVPHASHLQNPEITCRDCHGYVRPDALASLPPDGQRPTGHDFVENVEACVDCHESFTMTGGETQPGLDPQTEETVALLATGREAQLRVEELETALQTIQLQQRTNSTLAVVGGAAGGLLIGGVVVWLIARRRKNGDNNMSWRN